jgi:hypothetical protein
MLRRIFDIVLVGSVALMLAACGLADSHASWPEILRTKGAEPLPPEETPDVKRLVRENLNSVFVPSSNPRGVQVSPPIYNPRGLGWNACVRAALTNTLGKPMGVETYQITISSGVIVDRQRSEGEAGCAIESYEPIQ